MTERLFNYDAAVEFLYGRINYERVDSQGYSNSDFKLDRMRTLLTLIGNPQDRIPAVHVAGTKGKGSTCSMLASVLSAASLRTGLYISPHITSFEERMTVNGIRPTREELVHMVNRLLPVVDQMDGLPGQMQPTYFELATAIAWLYFEERECQIVVLETGLGGRLDSTNICRPLVCVITNISRDHTHILGSTISQIAWEKAGIIKSNVTVISGVWQLEAIGQIEKICMERSAPLRLLGREIVTSNRQTADNAGCEIRNEECEHLGADGSLNLGDAASTKSVSQRTNGPPYSWVDVQTGRSDWKQIPVALRGAHQAVNSALALAAIDELRLHGHTILDADVRRGLASVQWPARVEIVSVAPTVVIDAAHNWESARALVATLREEFHARRRILIFAATKDKDVTGLLRLLVPEFDTIILTKYRDNPRGVPVQEMLSFVQSVSNRPVHLAESPTIAWKMAKSWADSRDLIAITGSFFLVAELRDLVRGDFAM